MYGAVEKLKVMSQNSAGTRRCLKKFYPIRGSIGSNSPPVQHGVVSGTPPLMQRLMQAGIEAVLHVQSYLPSSTRSTQL